MHLTARMGLWAKSWSWAAVLGIIVCGMAGTTGEPTNITSVQTLTTERNPPYNDQHAEVQPSLLEEDVDQTKKPKLGRENTFSDNKTWRVTKAKQSQKKTRAETLAPVEVPAATSSSVGLANDFSTSESNIRYQTIENESTICVGCGGESYIDGIPPVRALPAEHNGGGVETVTGLIWPVGRAAVDMEFRRKFFNGVTESQEDSGSGDPHVRMQSGPVTHSIGKEWDFGGFMDVSTASPSQTAVTGGKGLLSPSTHKAISQDSAEIDHLLQVSRETVLQSPSPSAPGLHDQNHQKSRTEISFETGKSQGSFKMLEGASKQSTAQGAQGSTDITMVTEKMHQETSAASLPPMSSPKPSEPPFDHSIDDFRDIDYYDQIDIDGHGGFGHLPGSSIVGGDSTKKIHDKKVPWPIPELYDDFTPFEETDFYPPTSFYTDGDEDGGIDDDDDDDNIEEVDDLDDDEVTALEPDISNVPKVATLKPKFQTVMVDEKPTGKQQVPHHTFVLYGSELKPKFHPDTNKDLTQTMPGTGDNGTECRSGYVRRNNSCKSVCDIYPTYCYNGGQCYIVENTGAFCRCNTQDYIWHKGMRCESIITDFQVMCVAVGTAALVVLLLFMMTVFFAKKLYLLKTENYKLRKRNRYRTPSELHNDNFSLSTIAEGSHPNEDPNAPQKVQDLPKACLKDEEPFNIQNSLSPKHESGKGDPDIVDVNCVLNNLT
ncbi:chondroitin sulfate proteoglycan 5 isoform 2-T2 [Discoglossus pictus]